jgi:hypothetical protein
VRTAQIVQVPLCQITNSDKIRITNSDKKVELYRYVSRTFRISPSSAPAKLLAGVYSKIDSDTFKPITLTITIESEEELDALYTAIDTVTDAAEAHECLDVVWDILDDIYREVKYGA